MTTLRAIRRTALTAAALVLAGQASANLGPAADAESACAVQQPPHFEKREPSFQVRLVPEGVSLPPELPEQVDGAARRLYQLWAYFVGEENVQQPLLLVNLVGGEDDFRGRYAAANPGLPLAPGFYSIANYQATVQFDPAHSDQATRAVYHELSHLLTIYHLGPISPWISEGLARYLENLQSTELPGAIYPNAAYLNLLREQPVPDLRGVLRLDQQQWAAGDTRLQAATAWSLIHFLMEDPHGRYALQDTMRQARHQRCQGGEYSEILGRAYPGGLEILERDWRTWVREGAPRIHTG